MNMQGCTDQHVKGYMYNVYDHGWCMTKQI